MFYISVTFIWTVSCSCTVSSDPHNSSYEAWAVIISTLCRVKWFTCGFPGGSGKLVKNLPAMHETWVQSLGQEDSVVRGGQTTPVFLPEKSHWQRSMAGYRPWDRKRVGHDSVTKPPPPQMTCPGWHCWSMLGSDWQILGPRVLSYKTLPICSMSTYFSRLVYKAPKPCLPSPAFTASTLIYTSLFHGNKGYRHESWTGSQITIKAFSLSDSKHSKLFVDTDHSLWSMANKRIRDQVIRWPVFSVSDYPGSCQSHIQEEGREEKALNSSLISWTQ